MPFVSIIVKVLSFLLDEHGQQLRESLGSAEKAMEVNCHTL
jgi:hypothetical protein